MFETNNQLFPDTQIDIVDASMCMGDSSQEK